MCFRRNTDVVSLWFRVLQVTDPSLSQYAAGDLRRPVQVTSRDEMGQLLAGLARMHGSLVTTVRTVQDGRSSSNRHRTGRSGRFDKGRDHFGGLPGA
ncbi:HAMP domain-containing protein [Paraburkholderia sp. RL17-337-BIB-A]|uniref:HAMP domain-containing protein n=1 Tax=Paraburkholderia sp. RL17-337-BIB-A TaxID=3031636 RepID=UPI0038BDE644